jgi:4-amino-4-deoxy-L-arabinose transferase-like glycosyltransferase
MAVWMAWLSRALFGDSLFGLRLVPALVDGIVVVMAGLIARELGGRRFAQAFAALCTAGAAYLIEGHLAGPTIYDLLAWTLVSFLVIRVLRPGDQRLWLAVGIVAGVGLEAKETILFLVGGLGVGLVAAGRARLLRSPWLWAGAGIALALWAPNLAWQVAHHWPTLEMDRNLRREHSGLGYALKYPVLQILAVGILVAPVWIAGLWALWRRERFRPWRAFAVAWAVLFVLLWIVVPDRFYYMAPLYVVLLAAGSVVTEDAVAGQTGFLRATPKRRPLLWRSKGAAVAIALAGSILFLPLALPVLTPSELGRVQLQNVNYNLGETIGWPQFVASVDRVWRSIPPEQRRSTVIVASNYGEAGAIDEYGPRFGLDRVYSGHNSYWWWGPPSPSRGTTISIGYDRAALTPYFSSVELAMRFRNPWGVEDDEWNAPIWICTGQRVPWPPIWGTFKNYG